MADAIVINKVDSASAEQLEVLQANIAAVNPRAVVLLARSELHTDAPIAGKTVAIVEDGPTLTHGGMTYGAGVVAARREGAIPVDPRPYAVGSIAEVLAKYPALEALVPAMGYSERQVAELRATLDAVPADAVLAATPIDLTRLMELAKPVIRVRYDLALEDPETFRRLVESALSGRTVGSVLTPVS